MPTPTRTAAATTTTTTTTPTTAAAADADAAVNANAPSGHHDSAPARHCASGVSSRLRSLRHKFDSMLAVAPVVSVLPSPASPASAAAVAAAASSSATASASASAPASTHAAERFVSVHAAIRHLSLARPDADMTSLRDGPATTAVSARHQHDQHDQHNHLLPPPPPPPLCASSASASASQSLAAASVRAARLLERGPSVHSLASDASCAEPHSSGLHAPSASASMRGQYGSSDAPILTPGMTPTNEPPLPLFAPTASSSPPSGPAGAASAAGNVTVHDADGQIPRSSESAASAAGPSCASGVSWPDDDALNATTVPASASVAAVAVSPRATATATATAGTSRSSTAVSSPTLCASEAAATARALHGTSAAPSAPLPHPLKIAPVFDHPASLHHLLSADPYSDDDADYPVCSASVPLLRIVSPIARSASPTPAQSPSAAAAPAAAAAAAVSPAPLSLKRPLDTATCTPPTRRSKSLKRSRSAKLEEYRAAVADLTLKNSILNGQVDQYRRLMSDRDSLVHTLRRTLKAWQHIQPAPLSASLASARSSGPRSASLLNHQHPQQQHHQLHQGPRSSGGIAAGHGAQILSPPSAAGAATLAVPHQRYYSMPQPHPPHLHYERLETAEAHQHQQQQQQQQHQHAIAEHHQQQQQQQQRIAHLQQREQMQAAHGHQRMITIPQQSVSAGHAYHAHTVQQPQHQHQQHQQRQQQPAQQQQQQQQQRGGPPMRLQLPQHAARHMYSTEEPQPPTLPPLQKMDAYPRVHAQPHLVYQPHQPQYPHHQNAHVQHHAQHPQNPQQQQQPQQQLPQLQSAGTPILPSPHQLFINRTSYFDH